MNWIFNVSLIKLCPFVCAWGTEMVKRDGQLETRADWWFDLHRADSVTQRGVSTNLMSRRRSMGSAAVPSTQMVKPTSSRVVVRMVRFTSVDVSLRARLNATAPLKPESREEMSEQTAGLLPSTKPTDDHLPTYYLRKSGEQLIRDWTLTITIIDHLLTCPEPQKTNL